MKIPESYKERIVNRSFLHYTVGYFVRLIKYIDYALRRSVARMGGAKIGKDSIIPWKLARAANSNLDVGSNVSINSYHFDLRGPIKVLDNVIINRDVEIIRWSHDYSTPNFKLKEYSPLVIEPYVWLATGCKILPSCHKIAFGTVVGAYSVLVSNTVKNGVYSGFPAVIIKKRDCVWEDLVVVSLNGGDWNYYKSIRKRLL